MSIRKAGEHAVKSMAHLLAPHPEEELPVEDGVPLVTSMRMVTELTACSLRCVGLILP